jgi:MYXO-CTERM domain-containing protein
MGRSVAELRLFVRGEQSIVRPTRLTMDDGVAYDPSRRGTMFIGARALVLSILLASTPALAQIRPKIMIIFDTSGSMMRDKYGQAYQGDGSELCTGVGKQTRIYQLKTALFEVLQGIGTQELDFALATYPMMLDPTRQPVCLINCSFNGLPCSGHYYVTPAQNWEYPLDQWGMMHYACKVSSHLACTSSSQCGPGGLCDAGICSVPTAAMQNGNCSDASNPCAWYPDYKKEVLKVAFGEPVEKVLLHFDQEEDHTGVPVLTNPEVRAAWSWYTPLGKSLFYAHGYLDKEVAMPVTDYRKSCEKLVVAFFTDGGEACNTEPADPFYPLTWASKLAQNPKLKVTVHTVGIDIDPSTQTPLQQIATAGQGTYYNVEGTSASLKAAFLDIVAKAKPPAELCNGKDDDCDSAVDEDFPQKGKGCDNGKLGVCFATGVYVCKADGSGVVCNAPSPSGTTEICDGLDNDCDGSIDEDIPGGCGTKVCQAEVCNGLDDDCDGIPDNHIAASPCGKDVGECKAGTVACVGGKVVCQGTTTPTPEVCDGKDNDCDGTVDGIAEVCYSGSSGCDLKAGLCSGICQLGTRLCLAGAWGACLGEVVPSKELCNGIDDDCDGTVDEEAECAGGQCIEGKCTVKCAGAEFGCPKGQVCKNGWCVGDTCDFVACEAKGWVCKAGDCVDPCAGVTCGKTEVCKQGACVDLSCYATGCPAGQICVQGACEPDPCATISCADDEFCQQGKCVKLCSTITCAKGEVCKIANVAGKPSPRCEADPCATVYCSKGHGEVCVDGKCVPDPCAGISCSKGEVCELGKCVQDLCERVTCPVGYRCDRGQCVVCDAGGCPGPAIESDRQLLVAGGGGCACALASDVRGPAWPLPLLLLALALLRRRRAVRRS